VSAFAGLKSAAAAGFGVSPHEPPPDAVVVELEFVVGVVVSDADLLLLEHAARPRVTATAMPIAANLRMRGFLFQWGATR
jgi:hypothetical protein